MSLGSDKKYAPMQTTFSTLFYPRGNDIDNNGNASIYTRITVNGRRSEFSLRRKIPLTKWSPDAGKMRGTYVKVRELNSFGTRYEEAKWNSKTLGLYPRPLWVNFYSRNVNVCDEEILKTQFKNSH